MMNMLEDQFAREDSAITTASNVAVDPRGFQREMTMVYLQLKGEFTPEKVTAENPISISKDLLTTTVKDINDITVRIPDPVGVEIKIAALPSISDLQSFEMDHTGISPIIAAKCDYDASNHVSENTSIPACSVAKVILIPDSKLSGFELTVDSISLDSDITIPDSINVGGVSLRNSVISIPSLTAAPIAILKKVTVPSDLDVKKHVAERCAFGEITGAILVNTIVDSSELAPLKIDACAASITYAKISKIESATNIDAERPNLPTQPQITIPTFSDKIEPPRPVTVSIPIARVEQDSIQTTSYISEPVVNSRIVSKTIPVIDEKHSMLGISDLTPILEFSSAEINAMSGKNFSLGDFDLEQKDADLKAMLIGSMPSFAGTITSIDASVPVIPVKEFDLQPSDNYRVIISEYPSNDIFELNTLMLDRIGLESIVTPKKATIIEEELLSTVSLFLPETESCHIFGIEDILEAGEDVLRFFLQLYHSDSW